MLVLLKLIPLKDWVYTGVIIALLIAFGWYTHHERAIGREQIEEADAKLAQARTIHNTEVETRAKTLTDDAVAAYRATVAAPPAVDAPHLWVRDDAGCTGPVRNNARTIPVADAKPNVPTAGAVPDESSVEHAVDIGPSLDKLLQDADAQVTALQAYIAACQDEGVCLKQ